MQCVHAMRSYVHCEMFIYVFIFLKQCIFYIETVFVGLSLYSDIISMSYDNILSIYHELGRSKILF